MNQMEDLVHFPPLETGERVRPTAHSAALDVNRIYTVKAVTRGRLDVVTLEEVDGQYPESLFDRAREVCLTDGD
jgi:hypothetical protein